MTPAMSGDAVMQPTRDPRATLPDLIEVLLNKGVYLNLDLIISVADIPLIGVNLRATIAGIETMLEYGMMRQWDEQTRAWVQKSVATHLPMGEGEEVIAKMAGGYYQDDFHRTWRPGSAYLTSRRLIIHRRDPAETIWEAELIAIEKIDPLRENSIGGEERTRILVTLSDGSESKLSAVDPDRLISLVHEQRGSALAPVSPATAQISADLVRQGRMWYLEPLSSGGVWRAGEATLSESEGFVWKSPMHNRALVRVPPAAMTGMHLQKQRNPTDRDRTLVVETERLSVRLAAADVEHWYRDLTDRGADAPGRDVTDSGGPVEVVEVGDDTTS